MSSMFTVNSYGHGEQTLEDLGGQPLIITEGPVDCAYGTGFTYASTEAVDKPALMVNGAVVSFFGRVKRTTGTGLVAVVIPDGYRPLATYPRVLVNVLGMNGGNVPGPVFRGDLNPANGEIALTEFTGTPVWGTGTWISMTGVWLRS